MENKSMNSGKIISFYNKNIRLMIKKEITSIAIKFMEGNLKKKIH